MTPMVFERRGRSMRAWTLARYLNFFAASRTRSRVAGAMDLATGELLRTMETVAGARSRDSSRTLGVTGLGASGDFLSMELLVLFKPGKRARGVGNSVTWLALLYI